jgi:hypothetical protein
MFQRSLAVCEPNDKSLTAFNLIQQWSQKVIRMPFVLGSCTGSCSLCKRNFTLITVVNDQLSQSNLEEKCAIAL